MPYICTLIACDDEKKALREEIARLDKALALGAREIVDLENERDALMAASIMPGVQWAINQGWISETYVQDFIRAAAIDAARGE